jgi:predicted nucleic-acid-binding Zn-ribbon protein
MNLTEEQKQEFLNKFQRIDSCPICHGTSFTLPDTIYQLLEYAGKSMKIGSGVGLYPVITIVCKSCGYTHLVNPIICGILKSPDDE